MVSHKKSSVKKDIRDMTFQEQLEALSKDSRFKELVKDIKELPPERQDALEEELKFNDYK
jgi:hypothetical protein